MSSRDLVLKSIKQAVKIPSHLPELPDGTDNAITAGLAAITPGSPDELRDQFAKELGAVSGEFVRVSDKHELSKRLLQDMEKHSYKSIVFPNADSCADLVQNLSGMECLIADSMEEAIRRERLARTQCACVTVDHAVADTASLAVILSSGNSLFPHYLPDTIYVVLQPHQLLANIFELFDKVPPEQAKNMLLITGPSRTADIEKILILGAHGPRRLVVYWIQP